MESQYHYLLDSYNGISQTLTLFLRELEVFFSKTSEIKRVKLDSHELLLEFSYLSFNFIIKGETLLSEANIGRTIDVITYQVFDDDENTLKELCKLSLSRRGAILHGDQVVRGYSDQGLYYLDFLIETLLQQNSRLAIKAVLDK